MFLTTFHAHVRLLFCQWFLCKQTWSDDLQWVMVPVISATDFEGKRDLWEILTPDMQAMGQVMMVVAAVPVCFTV